MATSVLFSLAFFVQIVLAVEEWIFEFKQLITHISLRHNLHLQFVAILFVELMSFMKPQSLYNDVLDV